MTATYFLVAATLPKDTPQQSLLRAWTAMCEAQRAARANAPATINGHPVRQPNLAQEQAFCQSFAQQAARIGVTAERSTTLSDLVLYSALGLGVMTIVAAGASWTLSGRALRPLREITEAAGRASRTTLADRLDIPRGGGELRELTTTFNDMLSRLDAAFAAQERFVADASHELRTPLTALRAVVEVNLAREKTTPEQLGRMGGDLRSLLEQAEGLIGALLLLSRSDARATTTEALDLAQVVDDALCLREEGFKVERDLPPGWVHADRLLIERAVANLVDNAVTHNDDRRWLRATTFSAESEAGLTIENTGPVVSRDEVEQVFRPFYRAQGRTGTGHGLGLAIVRSVTLAHGGRCEAKPRPDGGLVVTIALAHS